MISRPFALVMVLLTAVTAFMAGQISSGKDAPAAAAPPVEAGIAKIENIALSHDARNDSPAAPSLTPAAIDNKAVERPSSPREASAGLVNFADVAARINPAVVNIEATTRSGGGASRRRESSDGNPQGSSVRPQSGSGFVIERDGEILTNYHVIQNAERILVKFSDGRTLQAHVVGIDPETDIALIKVEATGLPVAPLGNSAALRVGEWVCAIGNPLAYEHTVTVGVVSYLGRKLFDTSLDNYIQTDAAINFGNSGGPLINDRGEVVGINSAISQKASNIGFAVPINEATAVLSQLKSTGRVARGFLGVALTDVDPDLQRSLRLGSTRGALVQDVTGGSPGQRAGLRAYDLIVGIDGKPITSNDEIVREVARRVPGTIARLQVMRDGRTQMFAVRLAERPTRQIRPYEDSSPSVRPSSNSSTTLGLTVRDLDRTTAKRLNLPNGIEGVVVTRVDPLSAAYDAGIQRDHVVLEINRRAIPSVDAYNRLTRTAHAGDVLAVYVYMPGTEQRAIRAIRVDLP